MLHIEQLADKDKRARTQAQAKMQEEELMRHMLGLEEAKRDRALVMKVPWCSCAYVHITWSVKKIHERILYVCIYITVVCTK